LEAYCKGGQGPPRAVAPPKKKNPSSGSRHFRIGVVDGRTNEEEAKHEESSVFADLRNLNMAAQWISVFVSFLVAVKFICGIETNGTLV
jgi:hypothetical protein